MESKYKGTGLAFRSPVLPYVAAKIQASTLRAMRHVSGESDRYVLKFFQPPFLISRVGTLKRATHSIHPGD